MTDPNPLQDREVPGKSRILILSAYDAGSHQRWREQLIGSQPEFEWHSLALPPRHFRWRIRGNALSWLNEPLLQASFDLILATSMVDLAGLRAFQPQLGDVPVILYMHENQFAYPDSGRQHSSAEPRMINLYSALAANQVVFNSHWNRDSFRDGIARFLDKLPDGVPQDVGTRILNKSLVLPVPIEDRLFESSGRVLNRECPHLLWNHRWEYDKGPECLLALLRRLQQQGQPFRCSIVGEQFRRQPEAFERIREEFPEHIDHWGYLESRAAYDKLLATADVVISTATHDFQGLSMLEAMAAGCLALAPDRLAYREYVPDSQRYPSLEHDAVAEGEGAANHLVMMLKAENYEPQPPEAWRLSRLREDYTKLLLAG
jgi:glycosyltransferase involved in cell wall biosynthesis